MDTDGLVTVHVGGRLVRLMWEEAVAMCILRMVRRAVFDADVVRELMARGYVTHSAEGLCLTETGRVVADAIGPPA